MRFLNVAAVMLLLLFSSSCGNYSERSFLLNEQIASVRVVAVLPFENLTENQGAGEVITELFASHVFRLQGFKVLNQGEMRSKLKAAGLTLPSVMDRKSVLNVARKLGVDGVFYGSVLEFIYLNEVRDGRVVGKEPAVGLHARLLDARSGSLIWSASHSRSSYEMLVSSRDSITRVAEIAIERMTRDLGEK